MADEINFYRCCICNSKIYKKWGDFCLSHPLFYPFICLNPKCAAKRIVYNAGINNE